MSQSELATLQARYAELQSQGLQLNLTRGKPSEEQVALSDALDGILAGDFLTVDGLDVRNYGELRGIPECRALGGIIMDLDPANVLSCGSSSLQLMYSVVDAIVHYGLGSVPAYKFGQPEAICPVPGYDRHFVLSDHLGIEMITVAFDANGPDMDQVESLVDSNPNICLLWCVPKHSNPTGVTYSPDTVRRIAVLPSKRSDSDMPLFVLWDNAYAVHDFDRVVHLHNVYEAAVDAQTEDRIVLFGSTSKITHAGAGVSFIGGSETVLSAIEKHLSVQLVGPDKVNQLRHARLLPDRESLKAHMQRHADIVKPKFDLVEQELTKHLGNTELATWTKPTGGYFVSLDLKPGNAKRVVQLAADAGLALTPAGATFPKGNDPDDRNLRIAPTYASLEDIATAMEVLVVCVKLADSQQH